LKAAQAGIAAATAAVETAKVNLGFTRLTSPIDGVAGVATTQVGNLVGPSSNAVTTVSTLDPIKANFTVSEQEYLSLTRNAATLQRLPLQLVLADGNLLPQPGRFSFADRQVNASTGAIQLTGLFPNPGNTLRPGQYAKVRATTGIRKGRCSFLKDPLPTPRGPIWSPPSIPTIPSASRPSKSAIALDQSG